MKPSDGPRDTHAILVVQLWAWRGRGYIRSKLSQSSVVSSKHTSALYLLQSCTHSLVFLCQLGSLFSNFCLTQNTYTDFLSVRNAFWVLLSCCIITRCQAVTRIADRTASQHLWGHVTSSVTWQFDSTCAFCLLVLLWNQASISNGFRDIQRQNNVTQWLTWPWYDL